jgi:ABC-type transport system substrate-binding protein/tRNA A-37 threonylcarbamoyl transferase component Bud32
MSASVVRGTVLGGFRVESLIGEGATGSVYLAEDTVGARRVALKVLSPELARDERFRQRFLRESQLAASLDHPHVVPTLASGQVEGLLYLAMAYVEGSDLRELLKHDGRLEPERTLNLLEQVAEALDAAHAAGLVHRDVKPGNILLGRDGDNEQAFVCDFGLARHVSSVSSLTGDRGFVGTIDYVPPEQIEGGEIDGRADVYSLGCVLYECLAGERPFERESELSVVFAHLNEPSPRLSDVRPELPEAFDEVFATALAKSPDDRYSTCGELLEAARAARRGKTFVRRRRRRRRMLAAAAALLVAAGATVAGLLASESAHEPARTAPTAQTVALVPDAVNLIDGGTHRVVARVRSAKQAPFASGVAGIAFSPGSAWVAVGPKQSIVRVDLTTRRVTGVIGLPWAPGGIATGGGSVWVPQDVGPELVRIDARTGKISGRFDLGKTGGANTGGVAYGDGSLWLAQDRGVARLAPRTARVVRLFHAPARLLAFADGAVWAATPGDGRVTKIDPVENRIAARTKLHGWLSDLAVGGGSVWASILPDGVVFRLSEDDLGVQSVPAAGADPERISFGGGHLWIANTAARSVSLLDQVSGARQRLAAAAGPTLAEYHDGLVWTSAAPAPAPLAPIAGEEIRVSTPTDTAVDPDPMGGRGSVQQFMYAICSNLLNYPDSSGLQGARLRPEIAAAMPTVSRDGRTYTFHIRPGFRFSPPSHEPVTAETFRHTLERSLSPKNQYSAGPQLASDIAGVTAYRAGKTAHISGIAARGNTLSIALVKPAGDFLTRLSMPAFCPVPLSVPIHVNGFTEHPLPSAGPYYIASLQGDRAVLLRNPNYHGNRPRRPERIVFTNDIPTPKAVALADAGALDLLPQDFDNTTSLLWLGGALDRRAGAKSSAAQTGRQQYFLYAAPHVDYIVFNTRRPLFRDVRLRRAVSYALDRRALAASFSDGPADQIVSPAVPGFPAGRVYPLQPDLATARRLAGGRSRSAVLYFCGNPQERKVAQIVRSNLARIRMSVSIVESQDCPGRWQDADLLLQTDLQSEERDPMPFLDKALSSGDFGSPLGPGPWNDPTFRRQLERARPLRGDARIAVYRRLVGELTRIAPFAVYGTYVWSQYLSPKVGCRVFLSEYGFVDLGALCKKG